MSDNFDAVKTIADRLGLPLRFASDLEIDRRVMTACPGEQWVWIVCKDGTHLWSFNRYANEHRGCTFGQWVRAAKMNCDGPHFYFVADGTARPLTDEELSREHWTGE